ncbi:MAG: SpvB/TcaC N-terminal domain-containing protein, partial [bacterium]
MQRSISAAPWLVTLAFSCILQVRGAEAVTERPAPMHTAGRFEVDDSGTATYTVPLVVPPGTAGMQPSLSLVYSGRSGNGMLGVGWALSGLSVIHRCPATLAQDGFIDSVDFDSSDRLCLDGQRLMLESGSGYGANGAEHRTERESFTKVISYGTVGVGPSYFRAWTKAGLMMEYGGTADSKIEAQGKTSIRVWALNRIEDTEGNAITVSYNEDSTNGQYTPARIDFPPGLSVQFEYETISVAPLLYVGGSLVKNYSRVKTIRTYTGATLVYEYRLQYQTSASTQRSQLTTITECGAGTTCLPPTSVAWVTFLNNTFPSGESTSNPAGQDSNLNNRAPLFADFNGDGLTDVFWERKNNDSGKTTYD